MTKLPMIWRYILLSILLVNVAIVTVIAPGLVLAGIIKTIEPTVLNSIYITLPVLTAAFGFRTLEKVYKVDRTSLKD